MRTVRTECLDWTLLTGPRHLQRILTVYVLHHNTVRPHRSLELAPPLGDDVEPDAVAGRIVRRDLLGGLIHEYNRAA